MPATTTDEAVRRTAGALRTVERCGGTGTSLGAGLCCGQIVDCPTCGRPVRATKRRLVRAHTTVVSRNTRAADNRLRRMRALGIDTIVAAILVQVQS